MRNVEESLAGIRLARNVWIAAHTKMRNLEAELVTARNDERNAKADYENAQGRLLSTIDEEQPQ